MNASLAILTNVIMIMVIGILITILAKKLKISNLLLLLLAGLGLGWVARNSGVMEVPSSLMLPIAVVALAIIVFYGSSQFKLKALDNFSISALKLTSVFLFFNMLFLGLIISIIFFEEWSFINLLYSLIFAIIVTGTDPASVFAMLKSKTHRIVEFLETEAILNSPIIVILPFIILDIILDGGTIVAIDWQSYFVAILTQVLVGIGSGIFIGIIFFKAMKSFYSEDLSPLAIIISALLSYILAENLGGSGVLAVAVLGFFFGNISLAGKYSLQSFSNTISSALEILVFILLGFIITLNVDYIFVIKSIGIFGLIILSRYLAVKWTLKKDNYTNKEKWFITLNMPKGIAVAVLIFSLSVFGLQQLETINNLLILVMIYSLVLSTIVNKLSKHFISIKIND